jgi:hypothetical protein
MILTLYIDQIAPARYEAVMTAGTVEVSETATVHASIAKAISESALAVPAGFAFFIEPRYAGISAGTMRIADAARDELAESAAQTIVRLLAEMHALDAG